MTSKKVGGAEFIDQVSNYQFIKGLRPYYT